MNPNVSESASYFDRNIKRGIEARLISIDEDSQKITYHCKREFRTSFTKPEEKVRASYYSELILDYLYPAKHFDLEVLVPKRAPEDRADIAIFEDEECKSPYLVVECKRDGISDAEFKQAIEQAFGNANGLRSRYAVVVAGITKTAFDVAGFKPSERSKNVIADIPTKFGKAPRYRFIKGDPAKDLHIVSREELISALEKCHDTIWEAGKLAPTEAFDEVAKLIFCKLKDEKDGTKNGEPYKFQIGTHETPAEVFARIDKIYQEAKKIDGEVFKENVKVRPEIVYGVAEHLQSLALNKIDLDTKGLAFERFMQDYFRGKMGQYFTPRPLVDLAVSMIAPTYDELVLDHACGSGGFLLYSLNAIRAFAEENYDEKEAWDYWHKYARNNLYGIEINEQIARVCKMNMILHDDGHTNIVGYDALKDLDELRRDTGHDAFKKGEFHIVLTNPPFGAKLKSSQHPYLESYVFGQRITKNGKIKARKQQKSEIIFLERLREFLKPDIGRCAIILPDGILTRAYCTT